METNFCHMASPIYAAISECGLGAAYQRLDISLAFLALFWGWVGGGDGVVVFDIKCADKHPHVV